MPKSSSIRSAVSIEHRLVTDRRRDGQTQAHGWYRRCIRSRGKNRFFCRDSAPDPAGGAYDAPTNPLVAWGGDSLPRPHSPSPRRLRRLDPRRLELHAFGVSGSTLATCPPKTLFGPLLARLWRRRCVTGGEVEGEGVDMAGPLACYVTPLLQHQAQFGLNPALQSR